MSISSYLTQQIDNADYCSRQMRGRAGRKGKDEIGETYLCCQKSDLEAVAELMEAEIPSVESCLVPGKRGIKRSRGSDTPINCSLLIRIKGIT